MTDVPAGGDAAVTPDERWCPIRTSLSIRDSEGEMDASTTRKRVLAVANLAGVVLIVSLIVAMSSAARAAQSPVGGFR